MQRDTISQTLNYESLYNILCPYTSLVFSSASVAWSSCLARRAVRYARIEDGQGVLPCIERGLLDQRIPDGICSRRCRGVAGRFILLSMALETSAATYHDEVGDLGTFDGKTILRVDSTRVCYCIAYAPQG